jgi:metallo-beta-lactamase class B
VQDIFRNARMVYGAPDWDAVEKSTNRPGGKPRRDLDGTDGMRLSIGDTSVQIVTMPGHTAGTLSYLFEIQDRGRPLRVAYVGGTAIPFNADAAYYDQYLSSSRKVARAAADFGATILLSNHTEFDNGYYKAHTAANRKGTDVANPFDVGAAGVASYFAVIENCVTAARMRAAATP